MRVVFATEDGKTLNGHFALCRYFMFYDVTPEVCGFVREESFTPPAGGGQAQSVNRPFCIDERIESLKDSDVIFVSAIGGPIADRVIASGTYPIEMNAPESIETSLAKLQKLLTGRKPLWLQRIVNHECISERT